MVEHRPRKAEVVGSSPTSNSLGRFRRVLIQPLCVGE